MVIGLKYLCRTSFSYFRERRRLRKEKRKVRERLVKKAEMHVESGEILRQQELFRLKDIRSKSQLEEVEKGEMVPLEGGDVYVSEEEEKEEEEEEEGESEGESVMSEGMLYTYFYQQCVRTWCALIGVTCLYSV